MVDSVDVAAWAWIRGAQEKWGVVAWAWIRGALEKWGVVAWAWIKVDRGTRVSGGSEAEAWDRTGSEVAADRPSEGEGGDLGLLMETSVAVILKRTTRTLGRAKTWTSTDQIKASSRDSTGRSRDRGWGDLACGDEGVRVRVASQEEVVLGREDEVDPGKVPTKAPSMESQET